MLKDAHVGDEHSIVVMELYDEFHVAFLWF